MMTLERGGICYRKKKGLDLLCIVFQPEYLVDTTVSRLFQLVNNLDAFSF